ncbi:MAG: phosphate/phosphite/phosphonate ABC transporter substrate-binding protein [Porcipelethomonas sp.]
MKAKKMFAGIMAIAMLSTGFTGCGTSESSSSESKTNSASSDTAEQKNNSSDTITLVWYPNESAEDYQEARNEVGKLIEQATGKTVEQKLTTDYAIAIESLSNGTAQIGCCMGAEGYIQAKNANDAVNPLFVQSGESGTLDDALYYSFFAVREENADQYQNGDSYSIDNIKGKKMSFVSNSSTSGFKVPTNQIISHFAEESLIVDDLLEGGSDAFFSEVLFGGSHQGSAFNLLSDKCDVAAFCDIELAPYVTCTEGESAATGSVYTVDDDASAPFDTVTGSKFTVIQSIPVLNGPFAYNGDTLSPEDVKSIQDLFTSDEVSNDELIFYPEGGMGVYEKKSDKMCFVTVEDSWYDPIRSMES